MDEYLYNMNVYENW